MNSNVKFAIGLVIGAICGGLAGWQYSKRMYDKKFQTELDKEIKVLKGLYSEDKNCNDSDKKFEVEKLDSDDIEDEEFEEHREGRTYKRVIDDENYIGEEGVDGGPDSIEPRRERRTYRDVKSSTELESRPYIFDPDDGFIPENDSDYEHWLVFYDPESEMCVNEIGYIMDDVDAAIGFENLSVLKEMIEKAEDPLEDPPTIFVRNERLAIEYEVAYDNRNFR